MSQVVAVVLAFILTGLVGNRMLQHWQLRSWLSQQRFLGQEKEYSSLKQLSEELSAIMGARVYQMRRLLAAVKSQPAEEVEIRLKLYDDVLTKWNENLNSYYVRLTFFANYYQTSNLEWDVQRRFNSVGSSIEKMVRIRRFGESIPRSEIVKLEKSLDALQGVSFSFNRDILRILEDVRVRTYFGEKVSYLPQNLDRFSTWQLAQSLFIRNVDAHAIISPALHFREPRGSL